MAKASFKSLQEDFERLKQTLQKSKNALRQSEMKSEDLEEAIQEAQSLRKKLKGDSKQGK